MKISTVCFAVLGILLIPMAVSAQCRIGSGPDFGDGIPYCSQLSQPPPSYDVPSGPEWASRWGAIAIGSTATGGGVGVASDMKTRRRRKERARPMPQERRRQNLPHRACVRQPVRRDRMGRHVFRNRKRGDVETGRGGGVESVQPADLQLQLVLRQLQLSRQDSLNDSLNGFRVGGCDRGRWPSLMLITALQALC